MEQTRVDTKKLTDAIKKATDHLTQARTVLEPFLVELNEDERKSVLRVRGGFFERLPALTAAVTETPALLSASGFDASAVNEDAANVAALAPVVTSAHKLAQDLADTSLTWGGEAYGSGLAAYRVAKALEKDIPALRAIVDALAPLFEPPRRRKTPAAQ